MYASQRHRLLSYTFTFYQALTVLPLRVERQEVGRLEHGRGM